MSVSEFRYAVYSGNVWNERVELDDELFPFDEGECLCLSILKYFYFIFQFMFQLRFLLLFPFNVSFFRLLSFTTQLKLSFSSVFEKMKLYPFHRGKVDNLFVVVGGNCICHRCVFGE